MTISYKPLLKLLIEKDMQKKDLVSKGFSWSTISKFSKGEYVDMRTIEKLCKELNCQPADIVEYIED